MRTSLSGSKTHAVFRDLTQDIEKEDVIKNTPHKLGLNSEFYLINLILTGSVQNVYHNSSINLLFNHRSGGETLFLSL